MAIASTIKEAFEFLDYQDAIGASVQLEAETGHNGIVKPTNHLGYVVEVYNEDDEVIGYLE